MATTPDTGSKNVRDAIVVDLGKKKKKQVKQLRQGKGALVEEVNQVINELKTAGVITGTVQPVVVVVRERGAGSNNFPFLNLMQ